MSLNYQYTTGFSERQHQLLYLEGEKHLFCRKDYSKDRSKIYYSCYDNLNENKTAKCKARCSINVQTKECTRNGAQHTGHDHQDVTYRDMVSWNSMKDHAKYLATNFPMSAQKISIKEIFLNEMAK